LEESKSGSSSSVSGIDLSADSNLSNDQSKHGFKKFSNYGDNGNLQIFHLFIEMKPIVSYFRSKFFDSRKPFCQITKTLIEDSFTTEKDSISTVNLSKFVLD